MNFYDKTAAENVGTTIPLNDDSGSEDIFCDLLVRL